MPKTCRRFSSLRTNTPFVCIPPVFQNIWYSNQIVQLKLKLYELLEIIQYVTSFQDYLHHDTTLHHGSPIVTMKGTCSPTSLQQETLQQNWIVSGGQGASCNLQHKGNNRPSLKQANYQVGVLPEEKTHPLQ